jgi:adenylyl-sulfate kinase
MEITSQNITWTRARIGREERARRFAQRGTVVWLTGLSGSGKSTMAVGLDAWLGERGRPAFILDGDNVRHGLCRDLGFSDADRVENIRRTGEVGKLMAEAGMISICALISPFAVDRQQVRESCVAAGVPFIEVFINAPLKVCEARDPRGLYRKARAGEIKGFTGIDSAYEPPPRPELELRTDLKSPGESLNELGAFVFAATALP